MFLLHSSSFALFANFNAEMLIPLRARKSWPSRCFGCKVHRAVRHVFLGSSPKIKEIRWVKLHEQSRAAILNQRRSSCTLSVRSQRSHVLCPRNATLAKFPQIKPSPRAKTLQVFPVLVHTLILMSQRMDKMAEAKALWNLGWVGIRSIGVKRRV